MANNAITLAIDIRKNRNEQSKGFGHYYPVVQTRPTLSTFGLAEHMAHHNSMVSEEVLRLVLGQLSKCLVELVSEGVPVKLDGLGIFRPTAQSVPGGALSVAEASEMGATNLVKGIRMRFYPESEDLRDITSKALKKKCSLALSNVIELENVTEEVDGQTTVKRRLQTMTPVADWLAQQGGESGDGGDGGESGGGDEPRP